VPAQPRQGTLVDGDPILELAVGEIGGRDLQFGRPDRDDPDQQPVTVAGGPSSLTVSKPVGRLSADALRTSSFAI
jgi:hypothetical protein